MRLLLLTLLLFGGLRADKIHILEQTSPGIFRAVVHYSTPTGNNSANPAISWVTIQQTQVANIITRCPAGETCTGSVLLVGAGHDQILQAELDDIVAGTTVEVTVQLATGSCGQTVACANGIADDLITNDQARLQLLFDRYGQKVN